jgi:two-component system, OmpR family, sensor histidine kinase TctE
LIEAAANLVHNAVEYAPVGGEVTLTAHTTAAGATLGVVNTGPPVPAHVVERLGERFVRSEDSRGSGLGLAIAKAIAERHGGALGVRREGERNVVELSWPHAIGNA